MSTVTSYAVRYIDKDGFIRDFSNTREFVENVREIDKKVENITIRLDNFDEVEETLTKKINDTSTQLGEKITESHDTLNKNINELRSDLIEDLDGINNTIAETKEELTTKINNIETCTCDTSAIEKSINSINSQINSMKLNISSNTSQINSTKQSINTNTSNITTLNDNINLITTNMTLLEDKVSRLEELDAEVTRRLTSVEDKVNEMETKINELSTTLNGIQLRTKDLFNGVVLTQYDSQNYYGFNLYDVVDQCCKKLLIPVPSSQLKEEGFTNNYWYDMSSPTDTRKYIIDETLKVIGK